MERCPEGSHVDPAMTEYTFVWFLIIFAPIVGILEILSCLERSRRKRHYARARVLKRTRRKGLEQSGLTSGSRSEQPDDMDDARWSYVKRALDDYVCRHHNRGPSLGARHVAANHSDGARLPATDPDKLTRSDGFLSSSRSRTSSGDCSPLCASKLNLLPSMREGEEQLDAPSIERTSIPRTPTTHGPPSAPPSPPPGETPGTERFREVPILFPAFSKMLTGSSKGTNSVTEETTLMTGPRTVPIASTLTDRFTYIHLKDTDFIVGGAYVLRGVSAQMQHGELVGLMGESGSGKTTLLNVLSGRASYGRQLGELLLNGRPFAPNDMRSMIGFVPQAQILFKELTVYENLAYAAELRLHRPAPVEQREMLIEMALDLLGLQDCRHFVCDPSIGERLSGGQMRRVGIGMELVSDPPIMILDEPTSALDAVNTRLVVASLKGLAQRGILVIASLHQPRHAVYEMLDRLLLLRSGSLIYGGLQSDAERYFTDCLGYNMPPSVKCVRPAS